MYRHIVQTKEWADFKNLYGTKALQVGDVFYTKHKLPLLNYYYAYCPRIDPNLLDFSKLKESLKANKCIALTFDVPNVIKGSKEEEAALNLFNKNCVLSTRSEFAKATILIDLSLSIQELFENMHKKHRYNAKYAAKKGVTVKLAESDADFDTFFNLFKETAIRQNYFIRPKKYYELIWKEFHPKDMCHILTAEYEGTALASWMLLIYDNVIYYPYGGSSLEHKNIQASTALGWEVIRFGKSKNCKVFDMWGTAADTNDTNDPYYGFTNFKLRFGGENVIYIDSYDFIVNKCLYLIFTFANKIRWKFLKLGLFK